VAYFKHITHYGPQLGFPYYSKDETPYLLPWDVLSNFAGQALETCTNTQVKKS
jgi:hypothetical protein